jgi:hypothetical protein
LHGVVLKILKRPHPPFSSIKGERLSRYEYTLWRQVAQTLFALDNLNRRKPQERKSPRFDYWRKESSRYAPDDD